MICTEVERAPSSMMLDRFGELCYAREKNKSEVLKENAILIKTKHGFFVDIEGLSLIDVAYLYLENASVKSVSAQSNKLFMPISGAQKGDLFIDSASLKPYMRANQKETTLSITKVQRMLKMGR